MISKTPPEISNYLEIVEREAYPVCKEQKLLAAMIRRVFSTESIYVDTEKLARYMALQKHFLFDLLEWEKFCFTLHCCTYWTETDRPRFPKMLLYVGRGSGKNGYLAFENFCLLSAVNDIRGYHIDMCATSEDQAKVTFDEIREDVLALNETIMSRYFRWTMETIVNKKTNSKLRFRTRNPDTKDGLRPGKVDFDELHQYLDDKLMNVFIDALGKKKHPRITYATTDGYVRDGPLDDIKSKALDILNDKQEDDGLLPFMCRLDNEKEVENQDNWVKANPSLLHFPDLKAEMLDKWKDCQDNPKKYSSFLTKRMNVPVGNQEEKVTEWVYIKATNKPIPDLKGHSCVAGIDFMRTNDFLALGLLFKLQLTRYWITHSFVCRNSPDLKRVKAPLDEWAKLGLLTFIDDVSIGPEIPVNWLCEMAHNYNIIHIGIDGFRYALLSSKLESIGFVATGKEKNIKLVRPSNQQYVEPTINEMFLKKTLAMGDNPLMRWYINNTKKVTSAHGNFSYEKIEPKSRKTDGFMAFVNAMSCEDELDKLPKPIEQPLMKAYIF